jgi:hypothetical protein
MVTDRAGDSSGIKPATQNQIHSKREISQWGDDHSPTIVGPAKQLADTKEAERLPVGKIFGPNEAGEPLYFNN